MKTRIKILPTNLTAAVINIKEGEEIPNDSYYVTHVTREKKEIKDFLEPKIWFCTDSPSSSSYKRLLKDIRSSENFMAETIGFLSSSPDTCFELNYTPEGYFQVRSEKLLGTDKWFRLMNEISEPSKIIHQMIQSNGSDNKWYILSDIGNILDSKKISIENADTTSWSSLVEDTFIFGKADSKMSRRTSKRTPGGIYLMNDGTVSTYIGSAKVNFAYGSMTINPDTFVSSGTIERLTGMGIDPSSLLGYGFVKKSKLDNKMISTVDIYVDGDITNLDTKGKSETLSDYLDYILGPDYKGDGDIFWVSDQDPLTESDGSVIVYEPARPLARELGKLELGDSKYVSWESGKKFLKFSNEAVNSILTLGVKKANNFPTKFPDTVDKFLTVARYFIDPSLDFEISEYNKKALEESIKEFIKDAPFSLLSGKFVGNVLLSPPSPLRRTLQTSTKSNPNVPTTAKMWDISCVESYLDTLQPDAYKEAVIMFATSILNSWIRYKTSIRAEYWDKPSFRVLFTEKTKFSYLITCLSRSLISSLLRDSFSATALDLYLGKDKLYELSKETIQSLETNADPVTRMREPDVKYYLDNVKRFSLRSPGLDINSYGVGGISYTDWSGVGTLDGNGEGSIHTVVDLSNYSNRKAIAGNISIPDPSCLEYLKIKNAIVEGIYPSNHYDINTSGNFKEEACGELSEVLLDMVIEGAKTRGNSEFIHSFHSIDLRRKIASIIKSTTSRTTKESAKESYNEASPIFKAVITMDNVLEYIKPRPKKEQTLIIEQMSRILFRSVEIIGYTADYIDFKEGKTETDD